MNDIEKGNRGPVSYDDIKIELEEEGYFVLEEGTKFKLELGYTPAQGEYMLGESLVAHERRDIKIFPGLELKEDILVGRYVECYGGVYKNRYKFPLTNAKILYLEEKSREFQGEVIKTMDISEDYLMTADPDSFGDVDMSLLAHDDPDAAELLRNMEDPYLHNLTSEQIRLNKAFVRDVLGEDIDTEELESVRIITRL